MNKEKSETEDFGASHCSSGGPYNDAKIVVEQMIALLRKYSEERPCFYGELNEGIVHMLECMPEKYHPDDIPDSCIVSGLEVDSNGTPVA